MVSSSVVSHRFGALLLGAVLTVSLRLAIAFVSGAHAGVIGTVTIVNKDYTLNDLTIAPR